MKIGASSACFYPLETEKSFEKVAAMEVPCAEIFFNSPSELDKTFVRQLCRIKESYGVKVPSVHPFRSFSEGYDLFSEYKRRYTDALEVAKRYFEAMNILGAKYLVLHGNKFGLRISREEYAERYFLLNETAEGFGCCVAHENVVDFVCQRPEFVQFMKDTLGDKFKMVLDVKQARRSGEDYRKFIEIMGKNIVHVHMSDFDEKNDCIAPSEKGSFDFAELFTLMEKVGYKGEYIVELYSQSLKNEQQLFDSVKYVDGIYKNTVGKVINK